MKGKQKQLIKGVGDHILKETELNKPSTDGEKRIKFSNRDSPNLKSPKVESSANLKVNLCPRSVTEVLL